MVDWGWFMRNPSGGNAEARQDLLDPNGILLPDPARFPSANDGHGFRALAAWTHAHGLKFGVHLIRGIPKQAVRDNAAIANSSFHAADAADTTDTCPWDDANYGVRDNAAGQAYYDSVLRMIASWDVDFLKVDCISDHPYKPTEIRQIAEAIRKTGRPIVLSLSPGPTGLSHADEVAQYAQTWRIADDFWDSWFFRHEHPTDTFPMGVLQNLDLLAAWNAHVGDGHWPDADMLPIGVLRPHPGWGDPREARFTPDETRTLFTMWAIARSPLILGTNLTQLSPALRAMLTQRDVIALNQRDGESHPVTQLPAALANTRVWVSTPHGAHEPDTVAIVNAGDQPLETSVSWSAIGFTQRDRTAREIWTGRRLRRSGSVHLSIAPHAVALYRVD
ncbi:MAG: glycoside hydrolase family 27 protein [Alphaproteobacteria bacterium]